MIFGKLDIFLQIAVAVCFAILVALLARPAPMMALGLGILGIVMVSLGYLARRRLKAGVPLDGQSARALVTQLMAELTRVQVAYLGQAFSSASAGLAWLDKALPRSFRESIDSLHASLERARNGAQPDELKLVLRIRDLQHQLEPIDAALASYGRSHPELTAAKPAIFVITEDIGREGGADEPQLCTVAGWSIDQPTVFAEVDRITLFGGPKKDTVLGQIPLANARERLSSSFETITHQTCVLHVAAAMTELPTDLELGKVPLGFLVTGDPPAP